MHTRARSERTMTRLLATLSLLCLAVSSTGCALCYTPYDDHYNAFGGVVERQDRVHGRVGSILSDPAFQYFGPSPGSDMATEADLYHLESQEPYLEPIEPQESNAPTTLEGPDSASEVPNS